MSPNTANAVVQLSLFVLDASMYSSIVVGFSRPFGQASWRGPKKKCFLRKKCFLWWHQPFSKGRHLVVKTRVHPTCESHILTRCDHPSVDSSPGDFMHVLRYVLFPCPCTIGNSSQEKQRIVFLATFRLGILLG